MGVWAGWVFGRGGCLDGGFVVWDSVWGFGRVWFMGLMEQNSSSSSYRRSLMLYPVLLA